MKAIDAKWKRTQLESIPFKKYCYRVLPKICLRSISIPNSIPEFNIAIQAAIPKMYCNNYCCSSNTAILTTLDHGQQNVQFLQNVIRAYVDRSWEYCLQNENQ
jgi:hypothetical protein